MKRIGIIFISTISILLILLVCNTCQYFNLMPYKEWLKQTDNDKKEIYLCGYYNNSNAYYWKVGENNPIDLASNSRCNDIYIYNNDIYISGNYNINIGNGDACYWKNNTFNALESPESDSGAFSIFISDGDVYICGVIDYDPTTGIDGRACYWKNGKLIFLSSIRSSARKIYVSKNRTGLNDIYVSGYIGDVDNELPCYWKNGKIEYLPVPSGTTQTTAFSLYYNILDLYTTGYYYDGSIYTVCFWKNNKRTDIASTSTCFSASYAINNDHGSVEIYYNLNNSAYYWKNGKSIELPASATSGIVNCFRFNDDIYACGEDAGDAAWWKNNILQSFPGNTTGGDRVAAIFVKYE